MYESIEQCKNDLIAIEIFAAEPTAENFKKAMKTQALSRCTPSNWKVGDVHQYRVPRAREYLYAEISRLAVRDAQRAADRAVWESIHPEHELSQDEKTILEILESRLGELFNCDAHNVNVCEQIALIQKQIAIIKGVYWPF